MNSDSRTSVKERLRPVRERTVLVRVGYASIVVALILFLLVMYLPAFRSPALVLYSYAILAVGLLAVTTSWILRIIHHRRLRNAPLECRNCGWRGPGSEWSRWGGCPECDSEEVHHQ